MAQALMQKKWLQSSEKTAQIHGRKQLETALSTCQTREGLQISVGDYVYAQQYINSGVGDLNGSPVGLCIAMVESLYEDAGGTKVLDARRYYRPEDLRHSPPFRPQKQEVYHTVLIDRIPAESVTGKCTVLTRFDFLKLNGDERSNEFSNSKGDVHFWGFTYSPQNGVFTPAIASCRKDALFQSDCTSSFKNAAESSSCDVRSATLGKELNEVLLGMEAGIPKEIFSKSWSDCRQAWISRTSNAKTMKEVLHSLLDLEAGVRTLSNDTRNQSVNDHDHSRSSWRKTVSKIQTFEMLERYIGLFRQDIQYIVISMASSNTSSAVHEHHSLSKRKNNSESKKKKLQKIDTARPLHDKGSYRDNLLIGSTLNQIGARYLSPRMLSGSPSSKCEIFVGEVYKIDRKALPPESPTSLKFMQAVLVAELTRLHVTVKFPSFTSLQAYFGKGLPLVDRDSAMAISKYPGKCGWKKETLMGTNPELDGHFIMTPKLAEKLIIGSVPGIEYSHQRHLWSFWVVEDLGGLQSKPWPSFVQKGKAVVNSAIENDPKGELGAAEALTQLIPGNAMVTLSEGKRKTNEESNDHKQESKDLLKSQVRRGMRSLRRTSFGNRTTNVASSISCVNETTAKDASRDNMASKRSLAYSNQNLQPQTRVTRDHDSMRAGRSSSMHLRRKEKLVEPGTSKRPTADDKSLNTQHVRSNNSLKLPKDIKGRWASERYKLAQLKLVDIMHERGAAPGKPILRPVLREEARKDIGDTGLLDHLLKHMTDTVVTNGERFRRRHNAAGAMEYWLEDANLMEIRNAAGIDDPFWIPPLGWKPGDPLPGKGGCGFDCVNRGMTPAEVAEMRKLKETVDKFKRELLSLSTQVKKSTSREVTPETLKLGGIQETITEICGGNQLNIGPGSDKLTEGKARWIKLEMEKVREELHTMQYSRITEHKNNLHTKSDIRVGSSSTESAEQIQSIDKDEAWASVNTRLEKIEIEMQNFSKEENFREKYLAAETNQLEAELSGLQQSVALIQENFRWMMKALGFSIRDIRDSANSRQAEDDTEVTTSSKAWNLPCDPGNTLSVCNPASPVNLTSAPGSSRAKAYKQACGLKASTTENMSLGMSTGNNGNIRREEWDTDIRSKIGPDRPNQVSQHASKMDRTMQNGFQLYKPPRTGSLAWRTDTIMPKAGVPRGIRMVELQDIFSSRSVPLTTPISPSLLGHGMVSSHMDGSDHESNEIPGSQDRCQLLPPSPYQKNNYPLEAASPTAIYHVLWQEQEAEKCESGLEEPETTHQVLSGKVFPESSAQRIVFQQSSLSPASESDARNALTILSVAAGSGGNDKTRTTPVAGPDVYKAQDLRVSTINLDLSPMLSKHCTESSATSLESCKCKALLPFNVCSLASSTGGSYSLLDADSPQNSTSAVPIALSDRRRRESILDHPAKGSLGKLTTQVQRPVPAQYTMFSAAPSPLGLLEELQAGNVFNPFRYGSQEQNFQSVSESQPQLSQHVTAQESEKPLANNINSTGKNLLHVVKPTMQTKFASAEGQPANEDFPTSAVKAKSSTWLGLALPTSDGLPL